MTVTRYNIDDAVEVTAAHIAIMESSNRSCVHPGYPSQSFIDGVRACIGIPGTVTHVFPPGYETTVKFGDHAFHMKDNWMQPIAK